jgi:hypothetical protein
MPRPVDEMIGELRSRWDSSSRDATASTRANDLASRLPLVHRTGRAGQRWQSIFRDARLEGNVPGTRWERETLGLSKTTYFFWGCGAYPKGTVALLLEGVPSEPRCSATPFDTGGCEAGHFLRSGLRPSEAERRAILDRFTLEDGARISEYGAEKLKKIVLRRREQLRELPPRYRRLAVVSSREDDFSQGIAEEVLS